MRTGAGRDPLSWSEARRACNHLTDMAISSRPEAATGARFVGASVHRKEDKRLLTGGGQYGDDVVVPGMLPAPFLRGEGASGSISRLDVTPAREPPRVLAGFTPP